MRLKKRNARDKPGTRICHFCSLGAVWFVLLASMITLVIVYESGNCVENERIMSENTSVLNQPVNGFFTIS